MRRGTTYTFHVNGGDDPASSSEYHPFYLTTSIAGGYIQQSPADRLEESVFAGIDIVEQTDAGVSEFLPTVVAPLCSYREVPESGDASAGGMLGDKRALSCSCVFANILSYSLLFCTKQAFWNIFRRLILLVHPTRQLRMPLQRLNSRRTKVHLILSTTSVSLILISVGRFV